MKKRKLVSMALSLMMITASLGTINGAGSVNAADTWRSSLYPSNWTPGYTNSSGQFLQDFSYAGYEKGEKEVPTQMSGMYANVVNYGADSTGAKDSTSAIQSAINAVEAAGGGTVYLPEGTYKVKPTTSNSAALRIKGSNILFKGAGKGKTFIRCYAENMRYSQVINVSPNGGTWNNADDGNYYSLSQDIPKTPTNKIHLSNVGNLKVGDWVIIRSDRTAAWINEHQMPGFWSASVNPTTMGTTFYRQITAVDKNSKTITIDIPTRYYMKTRDNARVYKVTPKQQNVGLSDFSIGNKANSKTNGWGEEDYKTSGTGAYDANNAFLIKFALNVNCFAKNISTYQAGNSSQIHMTSNGLDLSQCRSITIDSCDFSHPQYEGGGGNGYGMNVCSQEALIKNCSSTSARHSFSFKYAYASGNVIYHYTSTNPKYGSDFHMYLSMSNLIDNEELNGDFVESNVRPYGGTAGNRHGYTSTETVFWNTKGNYYKSGTNYIIDSRQFGNGYIIGTQGAATNVKTTPTTMSSQYGTVNTAPEDYKEGIGKGATLYPQSLYYDQLEKRLSKSGGEETVTAKKIPGTINATEYVSATSGITKNTSTTPNYVGNLVSGSSLEYKVNAEEGTYNVNIGLAAGDTKYNAKNITVKVDGANTVNIPVTGSTSWTEFVQHNLQLTLSKGEHTISISSVDGAVNIGDIVFTKEEVKEETTNVAKGKNVTTSGNETNEFVGKNAVDGNKDTRWSSNFADNAWITVDLGASYKINKVVLNWEAAYGESYKIQTSTDGNNWTTVKDLTNQNGGEDTISFNETNARYVRMQGVKRALPYGYSLYEFEVYGVASQTVAPASVISKNCTVTTSGNETNEFTGKNAVDGNKDTRWSSNFADNAWITVDLGSVKSVEKVVINWEAAYGKDYKIQTSTDGNNWTTVKNLTNQDGGEDTITFNAVNTRYVRMQGVTRALPYGYSIYEFEVYGR
ncbi:galactose-binding domain-containing protein [Eubacterium sp.]